MLHVLPGFSVEENLKYGAITAQMGSDKLSLGVT